jgi:hypothetical protein
MQEAVMVYNYEGLEGERTMMPRAVLSNGIRIANFCLPEKIVFEDGTILPACGDDRVKLYELGEKFEHVQSRGRWTDFERGKSIMSDGMFDDLVEVQRGDHMDVILVPEDVLEAYKARWLVPPNLHDTGQMRLRSGIVVGDRWMIDRFIT